MRTILTVFSARPGLCLLPLSQVDNRRGEVVGGEESTTGKHSNNHGRSGPELWGLLLSSVFAREITKFFYCPCN